MVLNHCHRKNREREAGNTERCSEYAEEVDPQSHVTTLMVLAVRSFQTNNNMGDSSKKTFATVKV